MADCFTNLAEERPADRKLLLLDHFPRSTMNPIAQKLNPAPGENYLCTRAILGTVKAYSGLDVVHPEHGRCGGEVPGFSRWTMTAPEKTRKRSAW